MGEHFREVLPGREGLKMAECIIARGGGRYNSSNSDYPSIIPGYCVLTITVQDSESNPVAGAYVTCNDGGIWHNNYTNDAGKIRIMTTCGNNVSIATYNNSNYGNGFNYVDQGGVSSTIAVPLNTIRDAYLNMTKLTNHSFESAGTSGNFQFRVTDSISLRVGGGGGGGGYSANFNEYYSGGGGGGGCRYASSVPVNRNTNYNVYVASGGGRGYCTSDSYNNNIYGIQATAGGTSTAFGYSATGGEGAPFGSNDRINGANGGEPNGGMGMPGRPNANYLNNNNIWDRMNSTSGGGGGGGAGDDKFNMINWAQWNNDSWSNSRDLGIFVCGRALIYGGNGGWGSYIYNERSSNGDRYEYSLYFESAENGKVGRNGGGGGGGAVTEVSNRNKYTHFTYWGGSGGNRSIWIGF